MRRWDIDGWSSAVADRDHLRTERAVTERDPEWAAQGTPAAVVPHMIRRTGPGEGPLPQAVAAAVAISASRVAMAGRDSRPALCGVELIRPKTACARARQAAVGASGCSRASTATHSS